MKDLNNSKKLEPIKFNQVTLNVKFKFKGCLNSPAIMKVVLLSPAQQSKNEKILLSHLKPEQGKMTSNSSLFKIAITMLEKNNY